MIKPYLTPFGRVSLPEYVTANAALLVVYVMSWSVAPWLGLLPAWMVLCVSLNVRAALPANALTVWLPGVGAMGTHICMWITKKTVLAGPLSAKSIAGNLFLVFFALWILGVVRCGLLLRQPKP